jgi:acetoacetyl-CoA synthetase
MDRRPLWVPSEKKVREANLTQFLALVSEKYSSRVRSYSELYRWSVENVADFWSAVWQYASIISSRPYENVVDDLNRFPGAKWFLGARLNFAENLLRYNDEQTAFVSRSETGVTSRLTYSDLRRQVGRVAAWLREVGVRPGDRVAGYLPNVVEAPIAMLAATSIGGVWACCGAELGPNAVLDRLGQIRPKVLFAADGYFYKGRKFDILPNVDNIVKGVPSVKRIALVKNVGTEPDVSRAHNYVRFDELGSSRLDEVVFEQLPADHPVYIMFTSGTTGKPKCMVQGAAGVLVNHLKEILLHADLKRSDHVTYIASPSWMMWNWLMSCLAVGSSIVLHDGNPTHPDWGAMWQIVEEEKLTFLGCSASYINHLMTLSAEPGKTYDLSPLREISQTGSPLSTEAFEWVYKHVKADLHLNSISGGTDINGCFAGGVPIQPVYGGELQAPGLGMKINVYDENGGPISDSLGELVCELPAPSMPLYFWDDPGNKKYQEAYFDYYKPKGKNVWRHGDFVILHSDTGGITFHGRSDAVLKISGVRIGTSEIYNVLDKLEGVADSLAVAQSWKDDQRIILFVKPSPGHHLSEDFREKIRRLLRQEASPKHVPAVIVEVPDIPYTFNMKKVETAVANIVNNRPVANIDAISNPECLKYYSDAVAEKLLN